jgi:hypothetical protein
MKATIRQDFDYSADGIQIVRLFAGETHAIRPDLFPGLLAAGLITAAVEAPAPVIPPVKTPEKSPPAVGGEPIDPPPHTPTGEQMDALDALDALEAGDGVEKAVVRHIGRGKYAIFRGDERLTAEAMTKDEAEAALAAMAGE